MDLPAVRGDASRVSHDSRPRSPLLILVAAAWLPLACLSPSPPPAGQHLLARRDLTAVYLSPSEQEGVPSYLLVTAPYQGTLRLKAADVYAVAPSSNPVGEPELLVEGYQGEGSDRIHPTMATDSLGRLVLGQASPAGDSPLSFGVLRVDVGTGTQELLAQGDAASWTAFLLSPARTQVCVNAALAVFALDGQARPIGTPCDQISFVGEDIYLSGGTLCGPQRSLCRMSSDGVFQRVSGTEDLVGFLPLASNGLRNLLLGLLTSEGLAHYSLLDAETLALTPLPPETQGAMMGFSIPPSIPPDTRWLSFARPMPPADPTDRSEAVLFLFNWTTGSQVSVNASRLGQAGSGALWRPGHDEAWFGVRGSEQLTVLKLYENADTSAVGVEIRTVHGTFPDAFTPDGKYWYSYDEVVYVGSADDPEAPPFPISRKGTLGVTPRLLADGRLLVESQAINDSRLPKDIAIVDPDTGDRRAVCGGCKLVALGQTRALLLVDWALADATGNLTLVDLDTLTRTRLAESVYAVAVDRGRSADVPPGTDALASGTQVAFLVRNRLVAPYDGLWLASLP